VPIMKNQVSRAACLLALLVSLGATTLAQNPNRNGDCSQIDTTKPALFITFESADSKVILLRLHNNSSCSVGLPTNQLGPSGKVVMQPNGGLKVEPTDELRDGSQVPVVYSLFNLRGSKGPVRVSDGCVVMTWQLLPKRSVIFPVPLQFFRRLVDVGVDLYEWEHDGSGPVTHSGFENYIFFLNESLPPGLIR
jgi:hypothetical protein